jgi:hypothetical protein
MTNKEGDKEVVVPEDCLSQSCLGHMVTSEEALQKLCTTLGPEWSALSPKFWI